MARLPRYILAGQPQHVIQRGNNRQAIFGADGDYGFCLEKLQMAAEKHGCAIHAYVLMTNHVHLLLTPQQADGIGKLMQMLGRYYVQYYNYTYQRTGTLWEGRYKATLIDTEQYFLTCMRYIELNPVRANNMAGHPSEYPWSSYRCNALGEENGLIRPHPEYQRLGKAGRSGRRPIGNCSGRGLWRKRWMKYARPPTKRGRWGTTGLSVRLSNGSSAALLPWPGAETISRIHFASRLESIESDPFDATVIGRQIVMLHQFVKKSEKTPRRELKIAWNRMKEIRDD